MWDLEQKVLRFITSVVAEQPAPKSLRERNLRQLQITERVHRQFGIDNIDALINVAEVYRQRFPH